MDRRKALKGLGLSMGFMVATPTVIGLLQSCKNDAEKVAPWVPLFFTADEATVVKSLTNLILPRSGDLPGASDVNVTQFLDLVSAKVSNKEDQEEYKAGIGAVINALGKPVAEVTTEDYDALLSKYLKATKEEMKSYGESEDPVFGTLMNLRGSTIWAYKTSEKVGKEVLAYDPIPGVQKGCISVEEATGKWGGRAWSL